MNLSVMSFREIGSWGEPIITCDVDDLTHLVVSNSLGVAVLPWP